MAKLRSKRGASRRLALVCLLMLGILGGWIVVATLSAWSASSISSDANVGVAEAAVRADTVGFTAAAAAAIAPGRGPVLRRSAATATAPPTIASLSSAAAKGARGPGILSPVSGVPKAHVMCRASWESPSFPAEAVERAQLLACRAEVPSVVHAMLSARGVATPKVLTVGAAQGAGGDWWTADARFTAIGHRSIFNAKGVASPATTIGDDLANADVIVLSGFKTIKPDLDGDLHNERDLFETLYWLTTTMLDVQSGAGATTGLSARPRCSAIVLTQFQRCTKVHTKQTNVWSAVAKLLVHRRDFGVAALSLDYDSAYTLVLAPTACIPTEQLYVSAFEGAQCPSDTAFEPGSIDPNAKLWACRVQYMTKRAIGRLLPPKPTTLEIGVQRGTYANTILHHLEGTHHLVDLHDPRTKRTAGKGNSDDDGGHHDVVDGAILSGRAVLHLGDSAISVRGMEDSMFDMIYIDAAHNYAQVKKDFLAAIPKLKKRGIIAFNDYTHCSPTEVRGVCASSFHNVPVSHTPPNLRPLLTPSPSIAGPDGVRSEAGSARGMPLANRGVHCRGFRAEPQQPRRVHPH